MRWNVLDDEDDSYFDCDAEDPPNNYDDSIELVTTGHQLVFWWMQVEHLNTASDVHGRRAVVGALELDGTELSEGASGGFFHSVDDAGMEQECGLFGAAIIENEFADKELKLKYRRTDSSSADDPVLRSDRSGIALVKLDDSWDYGRYQLNSWLEPSPLITGTSYANLGWNVEIEEKPISAIVRQSPDNSRIRLGEVGKYLVVATFHARKFSTAANPMIVAEYDGVEIAPAIGGGEPVAAESCNDGYYTYIFVLDVASGDEDGDLVFRAKRAGSSGAYGILRDSSLQVVKLGDPTTARLELDQNDSPQPTNDLVPNFHDVTWGEHPELDAANFIHVIDNPDVKLKVPAGIEDHKFLSVAQLGTERGGNNSSDHVLSKLWWRKHFPQSDMKRGANILYNRGYQGTVKYPYAGGCMGLLVAQGEHGNKFGIRHSDEGDGDSDCKFTTSLHWQIINLDDLLG